MTRLDPLTVAGIEVPVDRCGVLIIGSGAASLAAADRLAAFGAASEAATVADDIVVATESLSGGTSFNTGSDKQTYYRLSLADRAGDSAYEMAEALWQGGAVHGDIALAEAVGSAEAFFHLVSIGVPFPMNDSGGFVGYKTDHDPRQRGTSIGPYTSKVMVERLRAEVDARGIPLLEGLHAVSLVSTPPRSDGEGRTVEHGRAYGAIFIDESRLSDPSYGLRLIIADAVVFGVGGPGGLYESSAYPAVHSGAIGLAVEAGAACVNLTESQYGLASVEYRWNVSGTYQQAVPRYVSVGPEGDEEEFLSPFFSSPGARDSAVFLKGYQWPFDPRKVRDHGSSLIDLLVHRERLVRGRRVYLDFTKNPSGWNPDALSPEARAYLEKSGATSGAPLDRLCRMNPIAVEHYARNGIDLSRRMLELAVCAQHNNGGLAADSWWESTNIDRLFPVGEVNGSHGVYRPGGAALNAGQVGALRAARRIIGALRRGDAADAPWRSVAAARVAALLRIVSTALGSAASAESLESYEREFRARMDLHGGIIRAAGDARRAASEALDQVNRFPSLAVGARGELVRLLRARQLVLAHAAYLDACASYAEAGGGARGSAIVAAPGGESLNAALEPSWNALPEKRELLDYLQETRWDGARFATRWLPRRPIPESDDWFENVWRAFRDGDMHKRRR